MHLLSWSSCIDVSLSVISRVRTVCVTSKEIHPGSVSLLRFLLTEHYCDCWILTRYFIKRNEDIGSNFPFNLHSVFDVWSDCDICSIPWLCWMAEEGHEMWGETEDLLTLTFLAGVSCVVGTACQCPPGTRAVRTPVSLMESNNQWRTL